MAMAIEEITKLFETPEIMENTINDKAMNSSLSKTDINNSLEQVDNALSQLDGTNKEKALSAIQNETKGKNNNEILDILMTIGQKYTENIQKQTKNETKEQSALQKENEELKRKLDLLTEKKSEDEAKTISPANNTLNEQYKLPPIRARDLAWTQIMMSDNNPLKRFRKALQQNPNLFQNTSF